MLIRIYVRNSMVMVTLVMIVMMVIVTMMEVMMVTVNVKVLVKKDDDVAVMVATSALYK